MKIEINVGTELVKGDKDVYSQFKPFLRTTVEADKLELESIRATPLGQAIINLMEVAIQHMRGVRNED